ncbi:M4 family metallopeptidase [Streptacidiphilus sp. ASG 303]|uniref:M4 family metallopeptidase n=1 Tax=Streptacidiphilus sp. ASG 303 TaxID=2896847 RepID=UPI001E57420B|nr:M4 family metallopeptidase [Streptacidiphilus sp. ASG 303]MCD0482675.1 M4 family metallopeptidase [Streptacidiphilus sp. ASG 303]
MEPTAHGAADRTPGGRACFCTIVPPHVLDRLAEAGDAAVRDAARRSLALDARHRENRVLARRAAPPPATAGDRPERTVRDARHTEHLPGRTVRREGGAAVADGSVNRAYDGLGATFALYRAVYGRRSIDGAGLPLDATVHYGRDYDNAFWDGERMVFGDGDGEVFGDFTVPLDVIGHELTHGVTQYTAELEYRGQSGALNESLSDVFGSLVKQYALQQTADRADWLIGAGLLAPRVHGVALRSMRAPGTAYDDEVLGKDPQPATMDGYVDTRDDDGGVHINSGIPNHAFYLAATALGGNAWERAGQVWYDALTSPGLRPDADFAAFAAATVEAARARYGEGREADAVAKGWAQVGVTG